MMSDVKDHPACVMAKKSGLSLLRQNDRDETDGRVFNLLMHRVWEG
jgi:hypothetical protein